MKKYALGLNVLAVVMALALPTAVLAQSDATLTDLAPSAGALTPVFESNTFSYAASVTYPTASMTVTPTAADTNATITVNGTVVASGSASGAIDLGVGATNVITTVVVSQDLSATNTYLLTVTRAASAARWWDGGSADIGAAGNGASGGGNGTWDTTIQNWDQGNGLAHVAWDNANYDTAIFGGTAGTVTNQDVNVGGLTFTAAYTLTSNTVTFGAAGTISNSAAVTIASALAGTGPITKDGGGTLTLSANNSYSGGTVINGGTVSLSANSGLGATNAPLTLNAFVTLPNGIDYGTRPVVLNNGATFYGLGQTSITIGGVVSGDGGFAVSNSGPQAGRGTVNLTGTGNTFTGPLVLGGGNFSPAFNVASIGDAPGAGQIQFAGGYVANFRVSGGSSPIVLNYRQFKLAYNWHTPTISNNNGSDANTLTVNTDLIVTATANLTFVLGGSNTGTNTFAGRIANGTNAVISLAKAGAGTWVLTGTNTYTGGTTISAGTLVVGGAGQLGGGSYATNIANSTTLRWNSSADQTLSGVISGAGVLAKDGVGTLTLAATNSYSGATTIRGGALWGVTGGGCAGSAVTVTNTPGNIAALGIRITDNAMPWTCASLAFNTNGVGAQLQFSFDVEPSITVAPLNITGNLIFNGAPEVVVNGAGLVGGSYPLLVVGLAAPSVVPTLSVQGSSGGRLYWENNTLFFQYLSGGCMMIVR